jgi:hypothetical protein
MKEYELEYINEMRHHEDVLTDLRNGKLTEDAENLMKKLALETAKNYLG